MTLALARPLLLAVTLSIATPACAQQPAAPTRPADAPLPEVLVDRRLAESVPLRLGDTLRVRALAEGGAAQAFVVAGVFCWALRSPRTKDANA